MKYKISLTLLTIIIFASIYSVEAKTNVAILDLAATGVSETEAMSLTNRVRNELFQTDRFTIVERERVDEVFAEQGLQQSGCTTSECIVAMGQILNAELMIAGSVDKLGRLYTIHLRMIDVESGEVVAIAKADHKGDIETVALESAGAVVQKLLNQYDAKRNKIDISKKPKKIESTDFQSIRDKKWKYGVLLGFNNSGTGIKEDNIDIIHSAYSSKPVTKLCIGFSFIRKWKKNLDIQIESLFITRAEEFSSNLIDGYFGGRTTIVQWEIPVLLKWTFLRKNKINVHLFTGFGIDSEVENHYTLNIHESSDSYGKGEFITKTGGAGFIFGFGMDYFLKNRMMTIDLRFSFGGTREVEIPNPVGPGTFMSGDIEFTAGSIIFGYYF